MRLLIKANYKCPCRKNQWLKHAQAAKVSLNAIACDPESKSLGEHSIRKASAEKATMAVLVPSGDGSKPVILTIHYQYISTY